MRTFLARRELVELAAALAGGYAIYEVASTFAQTVMQVVAEIANARQPGPLELFEPSPQFLSLSVGGVELFYGYVLGALLALCIVAALLAVGRALQHRCPHCRTPAPRDAPVCRNCALEMYPEQV